MCNTRVLLIVIMVALSIVVGRVRAADDPNLLGWWTLDETSGTIAKDSSGRGHDATVQGGALWAQGPLSNGALSFDGVDDMMVVAEDASLDLGSTLTIGAWIKLNNLSTYYFILDKQPSGTAPSNYPGNYEFRTAVSTGVVQFGHQTSQGTDFVFYDSTTRVTAGRWYHVAVTFVKGGQVKFYVDGAPAGSVAQSANFPVLNDEPVRIAGRKDGYSFFNGMLDDVRLYNRALNDAEIKGLAARPKAYDPNPADGTIGVTMPLLRWTAATFALFHNVYLGTSPDLTEADLVGPRQMFTMLYYVPGLQPGVQYYWRVDELDAAGAVQTGDVWSFMSQALTAYYPSPADGANTVSTTPTLSWMAGAGTVKHRLYFGDSLDAVTQGAADTDKGLLAVADAIFQPGELQSLTAYYWRADEVLAGDAVKAGPVWKFTTALTVDDFEDYTDDEGGRIYETWADGWVNGTGSTVGNVQAPFAEQTIVHEGKQAMPLDYNNLNSPFYSEAEQEFATAQDWASDGVEALVLYVQGAPANTPAQLYVALEDTAKHSAVVAHPDPKVAVVTKWTEWKIPLSSFTGVNPAKVKKLYLGVGDRTTPVTDGKGRLYIDDIRLVKP